MTENADLSQIPQATAESPKRFMFSVVWIIPILAAVVALGIAVERFLREGPSITIVFKTAEGIEAGKTYVKYKEVNIGQVTRVKLSPDYKKVVVTARIDKSAEGLLVDDAKFWVVRPQVSLSGISGIGTLLSGNYIGFEAGKSSVARVDFHGFDTPPTILDSQPGRQFVLQAPTLGSVGIGSPLYYRQLNVGRVVSYDLAHDGRSVHIRVFVDKPYDRYVTEETRFWQASGLDINLGAGGLSVKTESVVSMLVGGIAFELPPNIQDDKPAKANTLFTLYVNKAIALSEEHGIMVHYTLYFDESVRGLEVGAPVTLHGLSIGQVTAVRLENTTISGDIRPRVDIALYPERFLKHAQLSRSADDQTRNREACNAFLRHKISGGLRAQLRSGNIFLAQRFIALDFFPKSLAPGVNWSSERPQLPVVSSGLVDLETKVNLILAQMGKIPFQEIGDELKATLVSLNLAANRLEKDILPEARTTMEDLRHAIATADNLLKSSEQTMFGPNAPVQQEMREALQEISRAARAVGIFSEYLQQNPNALIRGKSAESP